MYSLKSALLAKQFFLFFSTVCFRGRLSNSEAVFIDDSLLLIVRPTLPLIATPRQGGSSQYQKSYLYLAFSICPAQPIFTNTVREMLSSHFLQTKIKARANLGQYWGCHLYIWEKRKMKISRQEKNLELFPCPNTCRKKNKCLESYAFPTCIDGGWSRWMWPLMPFSRSIEQPHSTVHMLCASSQRDMYLTFTA